jgi:hypothetical protein
MITSLISINKTADNNNNIDGRRQIKEFKEKIQNLLDIFDNRLQKTEKNIETAATK